MIRQVLDPDFMERHLHAFGECLNQEIRLHESGDRGALERARQAGITGDDLREARTALARAQGDPKALRTRAGQMVCLPPDATSSALQTALQQYLIERKPAMIASPGELTPGNDAITDVSITGASDTENLFQ